MICIDEIVIILVFNFFNELVVHRNHLLDKKFIELDNVKAKTEKSVEKYN